MTTPTPLLLIEPTGVLTPVATRPDRSIWPTSTWVHTTAERGGRVQQVMYARPVLAALRHIHDIGAAEIRWLSTWQHDIVHLARACALPDFALQATPEYTGDRRPRTGVPGEEPWWKETATRRAASGRNAVWLDPEAFDELELPERVFRHPQPGYSTVALVVSPYPQSGLTGEHLAAIYRHLGVTIPDSWEIPSVD